MIIKTNKQKKIVILGGGPSGIGAAWRLKELGLDNWQMYEKEDFLGGLSASFKDKKGFIWDVGGHIYFSKFDYFNDVFDRIMKGQFFKKERHQYIFIDGKFMPYPFQNNIRHLDAPRVFECIQGLLNLKKTNSKPKNFYEFNLASMGEGIFKYFMGPYNEKVWSWPSKDMSYDWIGGRVSVVNLGKVLENVILGKDEANWGPNYYFKYPKHGGSGGFWGRFEKVFANNNVNFNKEFDRIDVDSKKIHLKDKTVVDYDYLISTLPLDFFVSKSNLSKDVRDATKKLEHNSGYVIGVGVKGGLPEELKNKVALYFPEKKYLFQRMTVQNYFSENLVPEGHWALAFEVSHSKKRKVTQEEAVENVFKFLEERKFIKNRKQIVSLFNKSFSHFYPIPTLSRDKSLSKIEKGLNKNNIYSIGRFGAWRYESGNMDHSFMQGVEAINKIIS